MKVRHRILVGPRAYKNGVTFDLANKTKKTWQGQGIVTGPFQTYARQSSQFEASNRHRLTSSPMT
jgi:hypothetical protein